MIKPFLYIVYNPSKLMKHFLIKTDPDTYSIQDLEIEKETNWDGVHNYQAIGNIKKMVIGDYLYIYHSQKEKAIVGLAEVIGEPFQDINDSRTSWAVKIKFIRKYQKPLNLSDFKADGRFENFLLIRNSRLSVMEVPEYIVKWIESKLSL